MWAICHLNGSSSLFRGLAHAYRGTLFRQYRRASHRTNGTVSHYGMRINLKLIRCFACGMHQMMPKGWRYSRRDERLRCGIEGCGSGAVSTESASRRAKTRRQIWRHDGVGCAALKALEAENDKRKRLLAESLLDGAVLKDIAAENGRSAGLACSITHMTTACGLIGMSRSLYCYTFRRPGR